MLHRNAEPKWKIASKFYPMVAAPGTSCRHQVKNGTGKKALHPE
jgi:hypothetical protein